MPFSWRVYRLKPEFGQVGAAVCGHRIAGLIKPKAQSVCGRSGRVEMQNHCLAIWSGDRIANSDRRALASEAESARSLTSTDGFSPRQRLASPRELQYFIREMRFREAGKGLSLALAQLYSSVRLVA
jgi:hypothetical protein